MTTTRLFLVPATLPMLDAIADADWAALSNLLGGADIADHWNHFPDAMLWIRNYMREHSGEMGWWTYLILHRRDVRLIGTCGYKGAPTPAGEVEIGYEIADAYQGQGLATEAARALTARAFEYETVKTVLAHTLPEENASEAVLRKLGFAFAGEVFDVDDGTIWRWQVNRPIQ